MNKVPRLIDPRSFLRKCVGAGNGSGRPWLGPGSEMNIFGRHASRSSTNAPCYEKAQLKCLEDSLIQLFLNFSTSASFPLQNIGSERWTANLTMRTYW